MRRVSEVGLDPAHWPPSFVVPAKPDTLGPIEAALFPPFQYILANDVAEFAPFAFQILAQLVELHAPASMPESYKALIPGLLMATGWTARGNVPALVVGGLAAAMPAGVTDFPVSVKDGRLLIRSAADSSRLSLAPAAGLGIWQLGKLEQDAPAVPAPRTPSDDRDDSSLVKASSGMAVATLVSRLTGFLRTLALAATIGLGLVGSYRKHETIDVEYHLAGKTHLASDLEVIGD